MSVAVNIQQFQDLLAPYSGKLVAVTKTKSPEVIMEAYETGFRCFGENQVQELVEKQQQLPTDIEWHMIGHLQRNKVKYIAPFVAMIHGVDNLKLLREINKQGQKLDRKIPCLLQVHIAQEETKFGFQLHEIPELIQEGAFDSLPFVIIKGLMGMATFSSDRHLVREEFQALKKLFDQLQQMDLGENFDLQEISMGMSNDYDIALEEGSTMVRIGSSIFGARH